VVQNYKRRDITQTQKIKKQRIEMSYFDFCSIKLVLLFLFFFLILEIPKILICGSAARMNFFYEEKVFANNFKD